MNKIERLGYNWIKEHGATEIVFRRRETPDFLTNKGNFEIKRANGKFISFSQNQKERIEEAKAKVLVFEKDRESPTLILEPSDLNKPIVGGFELKAFRLRTVAISKETHDRLDKLRKTPHGEVTMDWVITRLLETFGDRKLDPRHS